MYDGVVVNTRACGGVINYFSITIKLYQESVLNKFLFVIMIDGLTIALLFADDIFLVTKTRRE